MIWTRQKLEQFLSKNNVDTTQWGKGMAKTIQHLFYELIKGECELYLKDGKVERDVEALSITVFYKTERLEEEYQKMKDGRFRRRTLNASIGEKLTKDDVNLNEAVKRALEEELSISGLLTEPNIHGIFKISLSGRDLVDFFYLIENIEEFKY